MRVLGIVLIIAGILMIVFTGFNFQTEKKVVDVGPIQVDKKENHTVRWPLYAGILTTVAGIVVVAAGGKKITS